MKAVETSKVLPVLYSSAVIMDKSKHKGLRLRANGNYKFAQRQNVLPVTIPEFRKVSEAAPVVFLRRSEELFPVMVCGFSEGSNCFVQQDGKWREGAYMPAYIRRYPFLLVQQGGRKVIGFDPNSRFISRTEGDPLFVSNGDPSSSLERVRLFCDAFDQSWIRTREFVRGLDDAGVIKPGVVNFSEDHRSPLHGFEVVDLEALRQLDNDLLGSWEKNGWLDAVHCHRSSLGNWTNLELV